VVAVHLLVPCGCIHLQCSGGLSAHMPSSRTCHTHLHFKLEIAKQLIAGYSVRKSYAGKKRKGHTFDNAISLPNLLGHQEIKLEGRKWACICCSVHGQRNPTGRTPETVYGCDRCGVHLCRSACFLQYHIPLTCSSNTIAQVSNYYYTAYTMHQILKVLLWHCGPFLPHRCH